MADLWRGIFELFSPVCVTVSIPIHITNNVRNHYNSVMMGNPNGIAQEHRRKKNESMGFTYRTNTEEKRKKRVHTSAQRAARNVCAPALQQCCHNRITMHVTLSKVF